MMCFCGLACKLAFPWFHKQSTLSVIDTLSVPYRWFSAPLLPFKMHTPGCLFSSFLFPLVPTIIIAAIMIYKHLVL